jgi:acyl-coenzyme A thioesterase PaaI-like protein
MSEFIEKLWEIGPGLVEGTPHARELGMKFVAVDKGLATLSLPYNVALIGDPRSRVISGGAVTTVLDQACGLAAIAGFDGFAQLATLSLRIDYQRSAAPGKTVIAEAVCYKTTRHVAFIRATAHDGDPDDPIATAQSAFMLTGPLYKVGEEMKTPSKDGGAKP